MDQTELENMLEIEIIRAQFQSKDGHAPGVSGNGFGRFNTRIHPALTEHVFQTQIGHEVISHAPALKRGFKTSPTKPTP